MKVFEMMNEPVVTCSPEATLASAARSMRSADYGTLPVIDAAGRLIGIITDRDICLAFAESGRNAHQITVHEVMTSHVVTAFEQDSIHDALATMKRARVRRLPVLDKSGHVKGLLSIGTSSFADSRPGAWGPMKS
jgi:CBS domain-containing protein